MSTTEDKQKQIAELEQIVKEAEARLAQAKAMLIQVAGAREAYTSISDQPDRVIMGTFSGEYMIDQDKKQYPVPANYASKSKLVEGDQLKLTITPDGAFVYKQIGPAPRRRAIATITFKDNNYYAQVGSEMYRLLTASVTYFRLSPGDEVTILTPLTKKSEWAAIENVVSSQTGTVSSPADASLSMNDSIQNVASTPEIEIDPKDLESDDDLKIQPW